jgi:hypothetical protein
VTDRNMREELRTDAAVIMKDFLILTRLRKKQLEKKRRTQLLMGLIAHAKRFHTKRECVQFKEEENESLLNRMQANIDTTLTELKTGVDSMRVLFESAKAI